MTLIPNSMQGRALARHLLLHGTCYGVPRGWTRTTYQRRLRELALAGVLRPWAWTVDGQQLCPRCPVAGRLWLAGPKWRQYVEEACEKSLIRQPIVFDPRLERGD